MPEGRPVSVREYIRSAAAMSTRLATSGNPIGRLLGGPARLRPQPPERRHLTVGELRPVEDPPIQMLDPLRLVRLRVTDVEEGVHEVTNHPLELLAGCHLTVRYGCWTAVRFASRGQVRLEPLVAEHVYCLGEVQGRVAGRGDVDGQLTTVQLAVGEPGVFRAEHDGALPRRQLLNALAGAGRPDRFRCPLPGGRAGGVPNARKGLLQRADSLRGLEQVAGVRRQRVRLPVQGAARRHKVQLRHAEVLHGARGAANVGAVLRSDEDYAQAHGEQVAGRGDFSPRPASPAPTSEAGRVRLTIRRWPAGRQSPC